MSRITNDIIKNLRKSLQASDRKTSAYDTQATIRRIEGGTAWVHIPGGVDETPVQLTINANVGDTVQVRVSGGRAFLVGNASAPPTDNTVANKALGETKTITKVVKTVQKLAEKTAKIAGNTNQYFWHTQEGTDTGAHITEIPQEEFLTDPEHGGGNLLARSNGIAVRDGLDELATFGADGAQIGKDGESHMELDYHSLQMVDQEGDAYFDVRDLRDTSGRAQITETFVIQPLKLTYSFKYEATLLSLSTVVILDENGTDVTSDYPFSVYDFGIRFTSYYQVPTAGTITATYYTYSEEAKELTFGNDSNGDPVFNVSGDGDVDIVGDYKKGGKNLFLKVQYQLGTISTTAGTPGTTSEVIQRNVQPYVDMGYTPISARVRYVTNSIIGFNTFFNGNSDFTEPSMLYVQIIRRQSSAASPGYNAYVDVIFMKT